MVKRIWSGLREVEDNLAMDLDRQRRDEHLPKESFRRSATRSDREKETHWRTGALLGRRRRCD